MTVRYPVTLLLISLSLVLSYCHACYPTLIFAFVSSHKHLLLVRGRCLPSHRLLLP